MFLQNLKKIENVRHFGGLKLKFVISVSERFLSCFVGENLSLHNRFLPGCEKSFELARKTLVFSDNLRERDNLDRVG